jgi:hypothetical protein
MQNIPSRTLQHVVTLLAGLLVLKVTVRVILNYHNYFPPNFESDFLRGRIGGLATVTGATATWVDPLATWMSWLVPLTAFELSELGIRRTRRSLAQSALRD